MSDFEEAKSFLQRDEGGQNLFDHVSEVLLKVLTERPSDAVSIFEQLSAKVKEERREPDELPASDNERVARYCRSIAKLHRLAEEEEEEAAAAEQPEDGQAEDPLPPPRAAAVGDLEVQAQAWAAAGVHVDAHDLFKLQLALARLAGADEAIGTVKLWGKLLGRRADYWVAEGTKEGGAADEEDGEERETPEPEANKFTYWVCTFPGGPWTELGPVRPAAITCARQIKRFLTGDLDAAVLGYPSFPGKERDYLRALIALISSECALAPEGYFQAPDEDGSELALAEEFEMPAAAELADPAKWTVYGPAFSSLGRVTPLVSEDAEGNEVSEPEGWETQWLREVAADDWAVRVHPVTLPDAQSAKAVLRSTKWPGACAVACPATNTWTHVYVGFGHSKAAVQYTPPMPPPLQKEFDASQLREQADVVEDPNPPEEAAEAEE